jgi:hypothetical protein
MPKATDSYNLKVLRPDLARQWHPTRNGTLGPMDVTPGSGRKIWWLCEQGHWWSASVHDRVRGMSCTYCRSLQKPAERRMVDEKPELLKEWHPSRNKDISAREVTCSNGDKVWWLCPNGHEWLATIRARLSGKSCPFCTSLPAEALTISNREKSTAGASHAWRGRVSMHTPLRPLHAQETVAFQGRELRRSQRYVHVATVMLESSQTGIFGYAQINNYSAGGIQVCADFPLRPGTLIKIELEKALYASVADVVESRVVWCKPFEEESGTQPRFGIGVNLL